MTPDRSSRRRRERPVWEAVKPRLAELVAEWEPRTTAKQRITTMRLHRQLVAEGYRVGRTLVGDYWRRGVDPPAEASTLRGSESRFLLLGGTPVLADH